MGMILHDWNLENKKMLIAKAYRALPEGGAFVAIENIIENYVGMQHGWTVPDHGIYDEAGAERHWKRLTTFFGETLG